MTSIWESNPVTKLSAWPCFDYARLDLLIVVSAVFLSLKIQKHFFKISIFCLNIDSNIMIASNSKRQSLIIIKNIPDNDPIAANLHPDRKSVV